MVRFFNCYEELEKYQRILGSNYEINGGKNHLSKISNKTKLIIVGTYIPKELLFFYTGKTSFIYSAIDSMFDTHMNERKAQLYKEANLEKKKEIIEEISNQLSETPIAFLDLSLFVLIKKGSKSDKDIKGFVLDNESFKKIDKSIKVIAVSELAKAILSEHLHIENVKYIKMFAGKSKLYPKGTSYKKLFIEEFKQLL